MLTITPPMWFVSEVQHVPTNIKGMVLVVTMHDYQQWTFSDVQSFNLMSE
jgi:hypothetical protein